ncbi:hypothetical protein D3C85_1751680 [compost metagenome]
MFLGPLQQRLVIATAGQHGFPGVRVGPELVGVLGVLRIFVFAGTRGLAFSGLSGTVLRVKETVQLSFAE